MRLILIRHAKAEPRDARRYPDDGLRPLTKEGREEQAALARTMAKMGISFDYLATSPLTRARETAETIAKSIKWDHPLDVTPVLGQEFTVEAVLTWLRNYPSASTVACVGHEPDFSTLAAALLGMETAMGIDFKKSGVMGIDFAGHPKEGAGTLLYFLRPKQILKLATLGKTG